MKNISKEDFILWNKAENKPVEKLDIVYHYTTLADMFNNGFKLNENEELLSVASLPIKWQRLISMAIEYTKISIKLAENPLTEDEIEKLKDTHDRIRSILIDYGNEEYGDYIIDEISYAVGILPTTVYYEEE